MSLRKEEFLLDRVRMEDRFRKQGGRGTIQIRVASKLLKF